VKSWSAVLSKAVHGRADFDNGNRIPFDLLVIPLIEAGDRIGSIVLVHDGDRAASPRSRASF
jgi:hypothetical protein